MHFLSSTLRLAGFSLGLVFAATALASEESQLIESINLYRGQLQRCAGQVSSATCSRPWPAPVIR